MGREERIAKFLESVVAKHSNWEEDFDGLVIGSEYGNTEFTYHDSGVGEDYVLAAFQKEWPYRDVDVDGGFGGCDTCGYGRSFSVTMKGNAPWLGVVK